MLVAEALAIAGHEAVYLGGCQDPRNPGVDYRRRIQRLLRDGHVPLLAADPWELVYKYKGLSCRAVRLDAVMANVRAEFRRGVDLLFTSQEHGEVIAREAYRHGVVVAGWLHSVTRVGLSVLRAKPTHGLCTSEFVRTHVSARRGRAGLHLFYPAFEAPATSLGSDPDVGSITLVNPIPAKGVVTFFQLARRCPERAFLAVEGWYPTELPAELLGRNVAYMTPTSDMTSIWKQTRVLLIPSRLPEAFGRVAVEAGQWGIPTIASDRGGLREAVGGGGILVDNLRPQRWLEALRRFDDPKEYGAFSDAAREHAATFRRDVVAELESLGIIV
jgi:glycosyltransferase involved in cell wall biosynthesis